MCFVFISFSSVVGAEECGSDLTSKLAKFAETARIVRTDLLMDYGSDQINKENSVVECQFRNNDQILIVVYLRKHDGNRFLMVYDHAFGHTNYYGPVFQSSQ